MTEIKNGQCTCKDCEEKRANQQRHMSSPFYQEVRQYVELIEVEQILKGAEKYPEPFTPDSWGNDELANHAMQENRDQAVYITGMRDRMRKQQKEIESLKAEIEAFRRWQDAVISIAKNNGIFIDKKV